MNATSLSLPPEVQAALRAAVAAHGVRGARTAIATAWFDGGYRRQLLEEHSGSLQRWRNSPNGHRELAKVRMSDFKAAPAIHENPEQGQQAGETKPCALCGGDRDADTSDVMKPGDTLCASCDSEDRDRSLAMPPAVGFFYNNMGYSYDPATQSPAEGRLECAKALAVAEAAASETGCTFQWEPDGGDSREWDMEGPVTPTWACVMRSQAGTVLESVGGVDFGDSEPWGQPYRRVVEAELALEATYARSNDALRTA